MSNFAFLQAVGGPETYIDCARAERYAPSDPCAASGKTGAPLLRGWFQGPRLRPRQQRVCA